MATIRNLAQFLCPRCKTLKSQVPDISKDFDLHRRKNLRDYARDATARVENAPWNIFDLGLSVGGELEILKEGSWTLMRVMHLPVVASAFN